MAKRGFLRLKISTDCPYFTILIVSLFCVVRSYFIWSFAPRCRLLLWWKLLLTAGDISPTCNHFWAYPVFCLGRERFCFSARLALPSGKASRRTASNLQVEILFPSGSMARKCREWLSPSGRVARKRRERSLNCTAESFYSTIFRHKKSRRYFHTADLIFIKTNSFLYNCIACLARIGLFQLYYKAPCF